MEGSLEELEGEREEGSDLILFQLKRHWKPISFRHGDDGQIHFSERKTEIKEANS